jgi:hypothetical protein
MTMNLLTPETFRFGINNLRLHKLRFLLLAASL